MVGFDGTMCVESCVVMPEVAVVFGVRFARDGLSC